MEYQGESARFHCAENIDTTHVRLIKDFIESDGRNQIKIDLSDSEFEDSFALTAMVVLLKLFLEQGKTVNLIAPPQMIVHNLFRIGMYPHHLLHIENMREDEPHAG
jgi:anti-anti-sigma regulatory factor